MLPVMAMVAQMFVCAPPAVPTLLAEPQLVALQPVSNIVDEVPFAEESADISAVLPLTPARHAEPAASPRPVPVVSDEFLIVPAVRLKCGRHVLQRNSLPPPLSS